MQRPGLPSTSVSSPDALSILQAIYEPKTFAPVRAALFPPAKNPSFASHFKAAVKAALLRAFLPLTRQPLIYSLIRDDPNYVPINLTAAPITASLESI